MEGLRDGRDFAGEEEAKKKGKKVPSFG